MRNRMIAVSVLGLAGLVGVALLVIRAGGVAPRGAGPGGGEGLAPRKPNAVPGAPVERGAPGDRAGSGSISGHPGEVEWRVAVAGADEARQGRAADGAAGGEASEREAPLIAMQLADSTAIGMALGGQFEFAREGAYLADLTEDGKLDLFDLLEFQRRLEASDLRADFSGDGVLDHVDSIAFQNQMAAGTREPEPEGETVVVLHALRVSLRLELVTEGGVPIELAPAVDLAVDTEGGQER